MTDIAPRAMFRLPGSLAHDGGKPGSSTRAKTRRRTSTRSWAVYVWPLRCPFVNPLRQPPSSVSSFRLTLPETNHRSFCSSSERLRRLDPGGRSVVASQLHELHLQRGPVQLLDGQPLLPRAQRHVQARRPATQPLPGQRGRRHDRLLHDAVRRGQAHGPCAGLSFSHLSHPFTR